MARPRPHGERVDVRPACGGCQGVLSCCVPRYSVLGITGATCHSALQRHPRPAVDCSRVWAPARGMRRGAGPLGVPWMRPGPGARGASPTYNRFLMSERPPGELRSGTRGRPERVGRPEPAGAPGLWAVRERGRC